VLGFKTQKGEWNWYRKQWQPLGDFMSRVGRKKKKTQKETYSLDVIVKSEKTIMEINCGNNRSHK
jgi:hypothetical protein